MSSYTRISNLIVNQYKKNPLMSDIITVSSGYRENLSDLGYYTCKNPENEFFIKYCVSGKGWLKLNNIKESVSNRKFNINKGDLILCPNNIAHEYGTNKIDPWSAYWVYFTGNQAPTYYHSLISKFNDPVVFIGSNQKLIYYFEEIVNIMNEGYSRNHIQYASNLLKSLLSYLIYFSLPNKQEDKTLDTTIAFMKDNIDKTLSLSSLSSILNISEDYFIKLFKNRYGYTPIDYFIGLKIQKATELLLHTNMTISEIAYQLGYNDIYYFSRIFKKKTGIPPRLYRRKFNG